jgi:hypothetical protein
MRSIYLARLEADAFGSEEISLEQLLVGTLRHDPELGAAVLGPNGIEAIDSAIATSQASPRRLPHRKRDSYILLQHIPLGMDCKSAARAGLLASARVWREGGFSSYPVGDA